MEKCVFCGKSVPDNPLEIRIKNTVLNACTEECLAAADEYFAKDRRYKMLLYMIILAAAVVILITALTNGGSDMFAAHVMQIIVGLAFVIFPYPVSVLNTYKNCPIVTVMKGSRIAGWVLALSGLAFVLFI
ncbi:MAG TPA: hypothetical protein VN381_08985 [Anaerovoracaceae bacterium]|nr:hypothetical protein [Anaerovoracaceae bacterium]